MSKGNRNYNRAKRELILAELKNITIDLNRGKNPEQCTSVTVKNIEGEELENISTSSFYGEDVFLNLFRYLDKKYGIKRNYCHKPTNVVNFHNDLNQQIINYLNDIFVKIYKDNIFYDKNYEDSFMLSFCANFGLLKKNKELYYKQYNKIFGNINPYNKFNENGIYNRKKIGKIFGFSSGEAIRQRIEKVLNYFKLCFLNDFEKNIYGINYILENEQDYIILENSNELAEYEILLDEIFDDYGNIINFDIYPSLGLIIKNGIILETILNNENVSYDIREKIKKFNKNCIYINGEKVICNRRELMKYCLKTYCKNPMTIESIQIKYKEMLKKHNLKDKDNLIYDNNVLNNKLSSSDNILKSSKADSDSDKAEYRYYESNQMDEVVKLLDLSGYKDVIVSADKIYKENIDLMKKFDIRNGSELHNLLRKKIHDNTIEFGRMPTISFGKADRDSQVLNLLKEMSPVSAANLAETYSKKYGDAEDTISGTYFNSIAKYKVGNEYIYNSKI